MRWTPWFGITNRKVNFVLDADIRSYFDTVNQAWLIRFLKHRINDPRMIRLIQKWLKAGILEDGIVTINETGTGQGSVVSPLLANVYLHYVFDLWAERWRRREASGDMIMCVTPMTSSSAFSTRLMPDVFGMPCASVWRNTRCHFIWKRPA